jgi:hypothetical protein
MQRGETGVAIIRALLRLAVNDDDLPRQQCADRRHPVAKTALERLWIEQCKDPSEGIVGRDAVWQRQELPKPRLLSMTEALDILPAVGPRHHRHHSLHDHVAEAMAPVDRTARVLQRGKGRDKRPLGCNRVCRAHLHVSTILLSSMDCDVLFLSCLEVYRKHLILLTWRPG